MIGAMIGGNDTRRNDWEGFALEYSIVATRMPVQCGVYYVQCSVERQILRLI